MSIQQFTARLSDKQTYNERFFKLDFELISPNKLSFVAGQYIILTVPNKDRLSQYSIVSDPSVEHSISLLVDIAPNGDSSKYLASLQFGDEIHFRAPAGLFVISPSQDEKELVLVATGAGIAPYRSMILDLLINKKDQRPIKLYWGMRHAHNMFWVEDFYEFDKEYKNFHFEFILSQPPQDWTLSRGYVTDLLEGYQKDFQNTGFYICGGSPTVIGVKKYLIEKNTPESHIHHEKFF